MQVICIHIYQSRIPPTVQVGGIYTVIKEGEDIFGFKYYEFQHQPGIGYDRNCFVPLDPELDIIEENTIKNPTIIAHDTYSKRFTNRTFQRYVPEKNRESVQALPRQSKPGYVGKRFHY